MRKSFFIEKLKKNKNFFKKLKIFIDIPITKAYNEVTNKTTTTHLEDMNYD